MTNQNRTPSSPNPMDKKDPRQEEKQNRDVNHKAGRERDDEISRSKSPERKDGSEGRTSQNW